jgi:hypothetical protein
MEAKMSSEQERETIEKLVALATNGKLNGEDKARRAWRFNGEFNLGHVFTILSIIGGAALFWSTSQLKQQDHEYRIAALEKATVEFKDQMAQTSRINAQSIQDISRTQEVAMRNQEKLAITIDFLTKQLDSRRQQ